MWRKGFLLVAIALAWINPASAARDGQRIFRLANEKIVCSVVVENDRLLADTVRSRREWVHEHGGEVSSVSSDADFLLDVMWTDWRAPTYVNNAENPVGFSKRDFSFVRADTLVDGQEGKILVLHFRARKAPFELKLTYELEPHAFFVRRSLAVRDPSSGLHFLRSVHPRRGRIAGFSDVVKVGGFGQPVAVRSSGGGAFFGLEYPTATNRLTAFTGSSAFLDCSTEVGEKIGQYWIESECVVTGISPNENVKLWFFRYLDDIRVAPLRPYLLYNTWYDLRAPEMVRDSARIMNEANCLRAIRLLRQELFEKRGVSLDAFVLDDGWDVYRSDWRLNPRQFPNGLVPLTEELRAMGSHLGIWVGPIGGYSHRNWRVEFMHSMGYETTGDKMCVAGQRYGRRLKELVTDFVRRDSVLYFKWDGILFTCSQPDHGHLPGIYSRRAAMETVIDLCRSVRVLDERVFTNITTGTWLSPWWLKYTNTIWMQGSDYGYANVPSISRRDRAITYRDYVLYDDLVRRRFWFPIANLMTHGIIKGRLQMLGGEQEPIEKFTDNAVLYFARGPMMWELYVSPDLLNRVEWDALAGAIRWAKDRWRVLTHTEMVGGDPGARQPYAYVHYVGRRGIVAARNPYIRTQTLTIPLDCALGLADDADSLVVLQVYPVLRALDELYAAGDAFEINLSGYELAVFEIAPIDSFDLPLISGAWYQLVREASDGLRLELLGSLPDEKPRLLNAHLCGLPFNPSEIDTPSKVVRDAKLWVRAGGKRATVRSELVLSGEAQQASAAFLFEPKGSSIASDEPLISARINGVRVSPVIEKQKGRWMWVKLPVSAGRNKIEVRLDLPETVKQWDGDLSAWLIVFQRPASARTVEVSLRERVKLPPLPPRPWPAGTLKRTVKLGSAKIHISR